MSEICNNCGHTYEQKCFCSCHFRARPDEPKGDKRTWRTCEFHGDEKPNVYGCAECVSDLRHELQAERTDKERYHNALVHILHVDEWRHTDAEISLEEVAECADRALNSAQNSSSTSESELGQSADQTGE